MATVSDLTTTQLSGLNYVDALLDTGPDWNFMTSGGNTITYTFSVASGNEANKSGQVAFSAAQQAVVRDLLKPGGYLEQVTGIHFAETAVGTSAQIHLANIDISGATTTGLCSWQAPYSYDEVSHSVISFTPQAYVYLDNNEWRAQNQDLTPGGYGYETLLHELGHALGLKHPFDSANNSVTLPASEDNTGNTLMSYTYSGGPYSTYRADDIAAFNWLYGQDGLGGALGINSTGGGRYLTGTGSADTLTGTSANDMLEGDGGNDILNGGLGTDTAAFHGPRSNYLFSQLSNGDLQVNDKTGIDGIDTLQSIEILKFSDMSATSADVMSLDTTAPVAPTLTVTKNANGYALGNTPIVTGGAEANATVTLYDASHKQLGTATADASGLWSFTLPLLKDGTGYAVSATATDAAGNVSTSSSAITFNIDTVSPTAPTANLTYHTGDNQATISGTGEAGTTIMLVRVSDLQDIASTTVDASGKWSVKTSPLPNGDYAISAVSVDKADNAHSATGQVSFNVTSPANITGTTGNDNLTATAGSNAIDGGAGIDTVNVAGARANYTLAQETWGYGLTDKAGSGGHDSLINVERVQFADASVALDIDSNAGQAYRLYQAAFDRAPDLAGMGYWIWRMDGGASQQQVASEFINQPEFRALYGDNPTDSDFVSRLYSNVLHRTPDAPGLKYWMDAIETQHVPRDQVLAFFSESPENQAQVIGSIQNGITFTPWHTA